MHAVGWEWNWELGEGHKNQHVLEALQIHSGAVCGLLALVCYTLPGRGGLTVSLYVYASDIPKGKQCFAHRNNQNQIFILKTRSACW